MTCHAQGETRRSCGEREKPRTSLSPAMSRVRISPGSRLPARRMPPAPDRRRGRYDDAETPWSTSVAYSRIDELICRAAF